MLETVLFICTKDSQCVYQEWLQPKTRGKWYFSPILILRVHPSLVLAWQCAFKGASKGSESQSWNWPAWCDSSQVFFLSVYHQIYSLYCWPVILQSHINGSLFNVPQDHHPLVEFLDYFLGSQWQWFSNLDFWVFIKQCEKFLTSHRRSNPSKLYNSSFKSILCF